MEKNDEYREIILKWTTVQKMYFLSIWLEFCVFICNKLTCFFFFSCKMFNNHPKIQI